MSTIAKEFIKGVSKHLQPVVMALHETMITVDPDYEIKIAWGSLAYKQGDNYSGMITEYKDHVKLMVYRGLKLDDPKQQLEGTGISTRHLKYFTVEDVIEKDPTPFIQQQLALYAKGMRWE